MLFFSTLFSTLVIVLTSVSSVFGWGRDGHALVADIAQSLLTIESTEFVYHHLPSEVNGNMSAVSVWADNILYANTEPNYLNWQWSAPLHYVNTIDWTCVYDQQNDCFWTSGQECVDGAVQNYTNRLANAQLDDTQLEEALKFIIHFIGDVHQPLHGGFASDRGGNSIRGTFFGQSVNFHSLWDTTMIVRKLNTEFQSERSLYLEYLIDQMNGPYAQNISAWSQCASSRYFACSSEWIQEDAELSCSVVYRDEFGQPITSETGFNITETYFNTRMDTVELRLIQAGVRLAAVINEIVDKNYTKKEEDKEDDEQHEEEEDSTPNGTRPAMQSPLSLLLITFISIYIVLLS